MAFLQFIKLEARRLGFQLVGVTTPDPPIHYEVFERWLEAGWHGEMDYLASQRSRLRRANPRNILPECQAILMLGIPYPSWVEAEQQVNQDALNIIPGRVATYAWGADYHNILAERLQELAASIETHLGKPIPHHWYCDTGAILERDLGQRAGLGWVGKNTCLIHPHLGSYFFLAEILLGLDLDPDPPFAPDYCGTCTRCIEACPTACIAPDHTLNASHCISYLTIELKGAIPIELRPKIGNWIFGCDICQQVCPWNQRHPKSFEDSFFTPLINTTHPNLIQELCLSPKEFSQKFKNSAVTRAKRRGYLRNVAVALGNIATADPDKAQLIEKILTQTMFREEEPLVRGHIVWALSRINSDSAQQAIKQLAESETNAYVQTEIQKALNARHYQE